MMTVRAVSTWIGVLDLSSRF